MYKLIAALVVFVISSSVAASEDRLPMKTVQDLFEAISALDGDAMRATATKDFELLEVGEVWDMDKLITLVLKDSKGWERRNYFSVISSRIHGDRAWVSYWNKADFKGPEGKEVAARWLESAVLIKRNGRWLLEMLHSTRLRSDQEIPVDVILEEYLPN